MDQPIALHVRRGDYLGLGYQGLRFDVTTPVYFLNAIKYMSARLSKQASKFFVFSNDIPWCKNLFSRFEEDFIYVENNDEISGEFDMYLMSMCKHFIISNSSFSWGGLLGFLGGHLIK